MHRTFMVLVCLVLAACAPRGSMTVMPELAGQELQVQPIFVASNRLPRDVDQDLFFQQSFGDVRDPTLRFGRVDLSVPPAHRTGRIEWPGGQTPDPRRHFIASANIGYSQFEFRQAVAQAAGPHGTVVVFVHGYNVNNAEAIYRLGQIAVDYEAREPVVAFSWPSAGNPRGYVYDRDSVMFSRDALEQLLSALATEDLDISLVAHSMGSQLVMETLRQLSISGNNDVLTHLDGVALISPDIDEDVFVQQAKRIHPFPQPFALLVSRRDRILDLSAFLVGKPTRLGSIDDPERLGDLPVEVIDLSEMSTRQGAGHSTAFTAPGAISLLRDMDIRRSP
ncbi:alpha/beta hydrolase [Sagittula sp. SSi028]|uniref:alpha/beta hydrolase n=1 Tax=Sagittula sp. SSi028 TaxID=3400636 RepID=UPI003AF982D5